jgi:hypothetical protein
MMNSFVYIFWWNKPHNVGCPIRVSGNLAASDTKREWQSGKFGMFDKIYVYILGMQDQYLTLSHECKVPTFWSGA